MIENRYIFDAVRIFDLFTEAIVNCSLWRWSVDIYKWAKFLIWCEIRHINKRYPTRNQDFYNSSINVCYKYIYITYHIYIFYYYQMGPKLWQNIYIKNIYIIYHYNQTKTKNNQI